MKSQYIIVKNTYQGNDFIQTSFGVAFVAEEDGQMIVLETISDLTPSFERIERFVKLCNEENLSYLHLKDVAADFVSNLE